MTHGLTLAEMPAYRPSKAAHGWNQQGRIKWDATIAPSDHDRPVSTCRQLTRASTPLLPPTVGSRTMS
jgi:hypothetical protein